MLTGFLLGMGKNQLCVKHTVPWVGLGGLVWMHVPREIFKI